jgi:hypothetical protein
MPWSRLRVPSWKKSRRPLATDSAHELDDLALPSRRQTQTEPASEIAPRSRFYASSVELPYQAQQPPDRRSSAEPAFWCALGLSLSSAEVCTERHETQRPFRIIAGA